MKSKFFTLILPMLLIVLALTSAFGTSSSAAGATALVPQPYELHNEIAVPCVMKSQICSNTVTTTFCRVGQIATNPKLWEKDEDGNCTIALYKP